MYRFRTAAIMAIAVGLMLAMVAPAFAQCGQPQVDPTNALLGIQGCANGQCNASSAASVTSLQNEVRALRSQLAARPASTTYRVANVGSGGGTSASASASSTPRFASRALYVVPAQAYAVEEVPQSSAASASDSASSSAASTDVAPSQFAVVPLSASDVQVTNACGSGGCGKRGGGILGGRLRARRGGSFSKSVAISST